ncbi:MAG: hypothetical protein K5634_02390 [Sphaerochaetaceae bacterium]|nr:hypothetical protein [Sphaerochaetaceae bacterium]
MKNKTKSSGGFFSNWQTKVICFLFAVTLYVILSFAGTDNRTVALPLEVVLPENYTATSVIPDSASVIISGSEDFIYLINPQIIKLKADFSDTDREGVALAYVEVNYDELKDELDLTKISFRASPMFVRIYFEEKK